MSRKTLSRFMRADGTLPPLAGCDPAGDTALREKLKEAETELSGLRDELKEKDDARKAAKEAFAGVKDYSTDSPEFKAAQDAVREHGEVADHMQEVTGRQLGLLKMLGEMPAPSNGNGNGNGPGHDTNKADGAWDSTKLFRDESIKAQLLKASTSKGRTGGVDLGQVVDRDSFKADISGTSSMRLAPYQGILPQLFRPLRVLDLLNIGTTDGNVIPYTQEGGTFAAAETAEGSAKPEDGVTFTDATALVQTIAAWQKILKQSLADYALLQTIIDGRLRYSVQRRLEAQVLNGNGTAPNLRGILQTSGIGSIAFSAGTELADLILSGITTVYLADAVADGVVVHPNDWQTMLTSKTSGSGEYFSQGPFVSQPLQIWGIPLVPHGALAQGTALVGDFAIGATLLIREGVNVLMSDSDQDDFIKNRVTMLGEMRAALPVWRPAAFCKVLLA